MANCPVLALPTTNAGGYCPHKIIPRVSASLMSKNIWPLGPDCLLESFNISKFQADITVWPIAPHVVTLSSPSLHAALWSEQLAMSLLRTVTITGVLLVSLSHSSVLVRWKVNPPIIQDAWRPIEHWRWVLMLSNESSSDLNFQDMVLGAGVS